MIFVDISGLSLQRPLERIVSALSLPPDALPIQDSPGWKFATLARLREGVGVEVLTGPWGAPFWTLASREVTVRIIPDGDVLEDRYPLEVWAGLAVGLELNEATELSRREKAPTQRHRLFSKWQERQRALDYMTLYAAEPIVIEKFPVQIIGEPAEQEQFLTSLDTFAAWDWEWRMDDQQPVGLAISTADDNYYLPVRGKGYSGGDGDLLQAVFGREVGRQAVMHNGRADLAAQFPGNPIDLVGLIDDTLVMAYLVGEPELGLKPLTRKLLKREPVEFPGEVADLPVPQAARYAAGSDTRNTFDLFGVLKKRLHETKQWDVYEQIEKPLIPIIASMEKYGSPVDVHAIRRLIGEQEALERQFADKIMREYGRDVADDSEIRQLIQDHGYPDPGSVDKRVLALYPDRFIDDVLGYRRARTLRRNFLEKHLYRWQLAGEPDDFRIYPRFNQAGTSVDGVAFKRAPRSGRLSSSGPNFQNQPRAIREIFVPPSGATLWSLDYSGLELHIAAALSGDEAMLLGLAGDLHEQFRQRIIELGGREVERIVAKTANFEQLYGGRGDKLKQILAGVRVFVTLEEADAIVGIHERTFPTYHRWASQMRERSCGLGYAGTFFGRRRYLPELRHNDSESRAHAERAAVNHVIQGTGADIVKIAMARAVPVLKKYNAHMSIQVHDELVGWAPVDGVDDFLVEMKAVMESVELPRVSLKVEGGSGANWKAAK